MSEPSGKSVLAQLRPLLPIAFVLLAPTVVIYLLSEPPRRWFWTQETVTKTETVWLSPWYMDAVGVSLLLLIGMVIVWGLQGGFPRAR